MSCERSRATYEDPRHPDRVRPYQDGAGPGPRPGTATAARDLFRSRLDGGPSPSSAVDARLSRETFVSLSEHALTDLIGAVYDAAAHPQLWDCFLAQFAGALGARVAFFHQHHFGRRTSEVLIIHAMPDILRHEYHQYYSRLNIWRDRGRHLFCEGRVILDQQICPRSTFERSEFYNDYLLRLDAVHSVTDVITRPGDESVHLTALHDPAQGPWHESDRAAIAVLL